MPLLLNNKLKLNEKKRKTNRSVEAWYLTTILGAVFFSLMMINFQHSEFEMIYRSFKKHQQKRAIEQAIMSGSLQKYYE